VKAGFRATYPDRACVCQDVDPSTGKMCGQEAKITDHVVPFRGDWFLFLGGYDYSNLQGMCQLHHNAKTVREGQEVPDSER
jgi:hypothetical protein